MAMLPAAAGEEARALESGESIEMPELLKGVVHEIYQHLQDLSQRLPGEESDERHKALAKFTFQSRQKLLRLLLLVKWCSSQDNHLPSRGKQLCRSLQVAEDSIVRTADNLYYLTKQLEGARTPLYEVHTATEVLTRGTLELPSVIENSVIVNTQTMQDIYNANELERHMSSAGQEGEANDEQNLVALQVDNLLRSKLTALRVPSSLTNVEVVNGTIQLGKSCNA